MKKIVLKLSGVLFLFVLLLSNANITVSAAGYHPYTPPTLTKPKNTGLLVSYKGAVVPYSKLSAQYNKMISALENSKKLPDGPLGSIVKHDIDLYGKFPRKNLNKNTQYMVDYYGGILVANEMYRSEKATGYTGYYNAMKKLGMSNNEASQVAQDVQNKYLQSQLETK
ncbi:MAG: hypothetical protein ACRCUP_02380 [Mycoplasmatales bacterium]